MGDMIDITTWPRNRNEFFKVTSSGIIIEIKSAASAAIGLAEKPGNSCDIWVVIGHNIIGRTWIKSKKGDGKTAITPEILNHEEYKRFWLSWRNGYIQLGQGNERSPIISHVHSENLNYVTLSSHIDNYEIIYPVHWRLELPPTCIREKPITKPITNGTLEWVRTDNHSVPDGALIGGHENEILYIMRAPHLGSLAPGKFVPSKGIGYITWSNNVHEKNEFEVLCGIDCTWVPSHQGIVPVGAVEGGFVDNSGEKLYVGRALHNGQLIPGKVTPSHRACYIPYEGRELALIEFDILVSPYNNVHCANSLLGEHIHVASPPNGTIDYYFPDDGNEDIETIDRHEDYYFDGGHEESYSDNDYEGIYSDDDSEDDDSEDYQVDIFSDVCNEDINTDDDHENLSLADDQELIISDHEDVNRDNDQGDNPDDSHEDIEPDAAYNDNYPDNGHEDIDPDAGDNDNYPDDAHEDIYPDAGDADNYPDDDHEDKYFDDGQEDVNPDVNSDVDYADIDPGVGDEDIYPDGGNDNIYSDDNHDDVYHEEIHEEICHDDDHDNVYLDNGYDDIYDVNDYDAFNYDYDFYDNM